MWLNVLFIVAGFLFIVFCCSLLVFLTPQLQLKSNALSKGKKHGYIPAPDMEVHKWLLDRLPTIVISLGKDRQDLSSRDSYRIYEDHEIRVERWARSHRQPMGNKWIHFTFKVSYVYNKGWFPVYEWKEEGSEPTILKKGQWLDRIDELFEAAHDRIQEEKDEQEQLRLRDLYERYGDVN